MYVSFLSVFKTPTFFRLSEKVIFHFAIEGVLWMLQLKLYKKLAIFEKLNGALSDHFFLVHVKSNFLIQNRTL